MAARRFTATPRGQRGPSNGGKRRPNQMMLGVTRAQSSASGIWSRRAMSSGTGMLPASREYTTTCAVVSRPHALHAERITHRRRKEGSNQASILERTRAGRGGTCSRDELRMACDEWRPGATNRGAVQLPCAYLRRSLLNNRSISRYSQINVTIRPNAAYHSTYL